MEYFLVSSLKLLLPLTYFLAFILAFASVYMISQEYTLFQKYCFSFSYFLKIGGIEISRFLCSTFGS